MSQSSIKYKQIPSTVCRNRLTKLQSYTLKHRTEYHCIDLENIATIDGNYLYKLFGNTNKLILDLGFGDGDQLFQLATHLDQYNFIGIELYQKGIVNLIQKIETYNIKNVKLIFADLRTAITKFIDHGIYKIQIFFPDPWPKLRHHKRRLINHDFLKILQSKLEPYGVLHIITDSENYAMELLNNLNNITGLTRLEQNTLYRPTTKFEKIAKLNNRTIYELIFRS